MPDVPIPSSDFIGQYNDALRRIRAVERLLRENDGFDPLQTFENGSPLGDTRFLNFGAGLSATLTGDGFVKVDAETGSTYPWDAVVDGALAASEPEKRLFRGIGEALAWLVANVPYMNTVESACAVYVRNGNDPILGSTIYTETANFNAPRSVLLFGASSGNDNTFNDTSGFDWRPGNFTPTSIGIARGWTLVNCGNLSIEKTTGTVAPWGAMRFINGRMNSWNTSGQGIFTVFEAVDSYIFNGLPNLLATSWAKLTSTHVNMNSQTSTPVSITAASYLELNGCTWDGGGIINLPGRFSVEVTNRTSSGGLGVMGTLVVPAAVGAQGYIRAVPAFTQGPSVSATGTFDTLVLEGQFAALAISGAHTSLVVQASQFAQWAGNQWDFTGPAHLDLNLDVNMGSAVAGVILRGTRIEASIAGKALAAQVGGTMRTAIRCIGLTYSNIRAALNATGTVVGGLLQPYDFDAASTNNFLTLTGGPTFPNAGTSASATNRVEEPPGTGVTGLAGSVVSETTFGQASAVGAATTAARGDHTHGTPTDPIPAHVAAVDPHPGYLTPTEGDTAYIAKAFMAAKGDLITATANDTPVIRSAGADGEILYYDSTQSDGFRSGPPVPSASVHDRSDRTSGNLTLNSTTWANVDTGLDLVLAAVAGDWVEVGLSAATTNGLTAMGLDAVSLVAGAPVNNWSKGGAEGAAELGVQAWVSFNGLFGTPGGSIIRQLVAGDLSGGNVTIRLRYRTAAAVNKVMTADTNQPLTFWARNLGQT